MSRTFPAFVLAGLAIGLALFGCTATTKPVVWRASNVSFANYQVFELQPVANAAGATFEQQDVAAVITAELREQFEKNGLPLTLAHGNSGSVLTVQSELLVYVAYEPVNAFRRWWIPAEGTTRCTLRTRLFDRKTNQMVAEIVTSEEAAAGGAFPVPVGPSVTMIGAPLWIVKKAAANTAEEIGRIMRAHGPG